MLVSRTNLIRSLAALLIAAAPLAQAADPRIDGLPATAPHPLPVPGLGGGAVSGAR